MTELKKHQQSGIEYQVRLDGKPMYFNSSLSTDLLEEYQLLCKKNPDCYVDIARVSTDIVLNQYEYSQLKKHFS